MSALTDEEQVTLSYMKQQKSNALMCQAVEMVERLVASIEYKADVKSIFDEFPNLQQRMILCPTCGNKRCPHAQDADFICTGSNDVGQIGVKG